MNETMSHKKVFWIIVASLIFLCVVAAGLFATYYYKNLAMTKQIETEIKEETKPEEVVKKETSESTVVESSSTPTQTESPVPAGVPGPSGLPVIKE